LWPNLSRWLRQRGSIEEEEEEEEKNGVFTQTVASFATFFLLCRQPLFVFVFSVSSIPNPRYNINIFTKEKLVITSVYQRMYYYIIINATKG
jgi:hypothetical protein